MASQGFKEIVETVMERKAVEQVLELSREDPFKAQVLILVTLTIIIVLVSPLLRAIFLIVRSRCYPITFSYKHVLVTGAGTGLGREIAVEMFRRGAYVTLVGKSESELKETQNIIQAMIDKTGKQVSHTLVQLYAFDIADASSATVESVLKLAEQKFGPIEVLVTCAGYHRASMLLSQNL